MSDNTTIVELYVPNDLFERLEIFADIVGKDRSEILVDALRSYLQTVTSDDEYLDRIAEAYFEEAISADDLRLLLETEDVATFRELKGELDDEDGDEPPV